MHNIANLDHIIDWCLTYKTTLDIAYFMLFMPLAFCTVLISQYDVVWISFRSGLNQSGPNHPYILDRQPDQGTAGLEKRTAWLYFCYKNNAVYVHVFYLFTNKLSKKNKKNVKPKNNNQNLVVLSEFKQVIERLRKRIN